MEEKKVKFSGDGAELSALMKKLQADGKNLYDGLSKEAVKQTSNQKEQNRIIAEQIKLYKEALKIQKDITAEKIRGAKEELSKIPEAGFENRAERVAAARKIKRLEEELATIKLKESGAVSAQSEVNNKNTVVSPNSSLFSDILKASLFKDMLSLMRQSGGAQNGSDLISPFFALSGGTAGAGSGYIADIIVKVLSAGQIDPALSAKLGTAGKEFGGFAGDIVNRSFQTREQFDIAYNKYRAMGGSDSVLPSASLGFSGIDFATAMSNVSRTRGTSFGAARNASFQLGLSRGLNIDESTVMGSLGMERSGVRNGSMQNMQRALGIAFAEGIDKTKFSDAIISQTQLLQKFAMTSNEVSGNMANRLLFEFNRMGGMFSIGDPRAMGNIMGIDKGLSQPTSPFFQAQNYSILRNLNPNADPFELAKMQEQGLQTPGFLKSVMGQITGSGFSEPFQKFMLKSRFSDLSFEAIDTLFKNKSKIGSMSDSELRSMYSSQQVRAGAEEMTSRYSRMNAEVVDAFKKDFVDGIHTIAAQFKDEIGRAIVELANQFPIMGRDEKMERVRTPKGSQKPLEKGVQRYYEKDGSSVDYRTTVKPESFYH